ncbi:hypothetical protein SO694_00002342 [Aureococcus anophagefferens]|uniref:IPT/TIG domain-containing protein n=1 Tax=Aureococcus anophagefferens TaxID=44056 RepID=A0ABR1GCV9_AURAN
MKTGTVPLTLALDGARAATAATFAYDAVVVVVAVAPRIIPGGGGTPVVVTLEDDAADGIACHFGDVVVAPTAVAGPEVTCPSPKRGAGAVEVAASLNGVDVSEGLTVEFTAPLEVHAAEPNRGPAAGGTVVALRGRGFEPSGGLACDFGFGTAAPAVFVSSSEIRCEAPPFPAAGVYRVRVKTADGVLDADGVDFEVGGAPIILDVDAVVGSPTGGAEVVVSARFAETPTTDAACRFGAESVPGAWLAPGKVLCVAPPQLRGASSLALSTNGGADYSEISADFSFDDAPEALSVAPSSGYRASRALLVEGARFRDTAQLGCRFVSDEADPRDAPASAATYVSATKLRCAAPDTLRATTSRVEVTVNGVEYSTQDVFYTRLAPPFSARGGPARGSELGGAAVRVDGVSVSENTTTLDAACVFGTTVAEARVVDGDVYCIAPALAPGFSTDVTLRLNGLDDVDAALPWSYAAYAAPSVGAVEPSLGSTAGDTLITVTGVNLAALAPGASCVFDGDAYVPAEIVGRDALRCLSPPLAAGVVTLTVASPSTAPLSPGVPFSVAASLALQVAAPATGPSTGGTLVTILGDFSTFSERPADASCAFGDRDVAAALVNASALACVAPAAAGKRRVALAVVDGGDGSRSSALAYDYEHPIAIYAMTEGLQDGALAATGANFLDGVGLSCRLAGRVFEAKWMSSTLVVCFFPPKSERPALDESTRAAVSNNGVDFVEFFGDVAAAGAAPEPPSFDAVEVTPAVAPAPEVLAVSPTTAPALGGTRVTIALTVLATGSERLACAFGDETVDAFFSEGATDEAFCHTPALAGPVAFGFSVDGATIPVPAPFATFRFRPQAHASSLEPAAAAPGALVRVRASNVRGPGLLACRFGDHAPVSGTYVEEDVVDCAAPATGGAGEVADVRVAVDGRSFGTTSAAFTFLATPTLLALSPARGWRTGGFTTTLAVSGVPDHATDCACLFGYARVAATFANSTLTCAAPAWTPTLPSDAVVVAAVCAVDGADVAVGPPAQLEYVDPVEVYRADPSFGSDRGGTTVSLKGANFPNAVDLACVFGESSVPATWVSSVEIECATPAAPFPATVAVAASLGGLRSSHSSASFAYVSPTVVRSAAPLETTHLGGAVVNVTGDRFDGNSKTTCDFGGLRVPATVVNASLLRCVAPARPPGAITVHVRVFRDVVGSFPFSYVLGEAVVAVSPTGGPTTGGGVVRVRGSGFTTTTLICFDGVSARTTFVSSSEVRAVAPPSTRAAVARVDACEDASAASAEYAYEPRTLVVGVDPPYGPENGGTSVTVVGRFSTAHGPVACRFGDRETNATLLSDSAVTCASPPRGDDRVAVAVSLVYDAAEPPLASGHVFTYISSATATDAAPLSSPCDGGTVVAITGTGFVDDGRTSCNFGGSTVDAVFLSATNLACVAPRWRRNEDVATFLEIASEKQPTLSRRFAFTYEAVVATDPGADGEFPVVYAATPAVILAEGGALVTVEGRNFARHSDALACRFGDLVAAATFQDDGTLTCAAPARIPSRVRLQVSNDGGGFWSPTYAEVTFASEPSVYALEPASGPLKGATAVRVFGSHFFGDVLCRFGDSLAPASVVSDVEVRCAAPPSDGRRPRKVAVAVSCDNETFSRSTATFAYDATPEVRSLSPAAGPGEGGTRVVLRGRGFKDRREARCRFGRDATVAAVFLSSERLLCVTPPHAAGEAMLEVSLNGVDFYGTFLKYAFAETPKIESLWPLMSMGQIGATAVSVFGSGFRNTLELACFFDNSRVPARFLSESAISCVAPARAPGLASVHVTVNGRDMASNTLNLLYVPEVLVTSVWPSRALATARAPVFVVGANFVNSTALKCAFGDVKVRGTYVSSSVVACVPPNVDALARGHRESGGAPQMDRRSLRTGDAAEDRDEYSSRVSLLPRYVEVRVSVNGLDYSDGAAAFEYYDELEKGYYETLGSAKPCPNGTLCRGAKPTNFTLCPPGTFQPRGGQVACLACPVGYYCPDFGLSKPVLCPGGFVCSDLGEREPKTLCPPGHYCNPGTKSSDPFAFANNSEYERDAETGVVYLVPPRRDWRLDRRSLPETGTYAPGIHPPRPFDASRPMSSSRAVLAELPFPCPPGTYCARGASSPVSIPGNFSTPQRCFDGYFCPAGSGSPEGEGPCPTGHFCPTQMLAVACPLGHHCPGVGNTFPRECVPGTYNGLAGMSNCTLCPTGHICPGWTRVAPEICPAGFVCSSLGLSMPVLTCPEGYFCPKGTLTLDSSDPTAHRPVPCAPGTFCVGGVAHNLTIPWIPARPGGISAPQVCTEGTFCREASPSAVGSRSCYPGHYCPPGVSYPIQVPLGSFADDVGYVAPTTCFPGTYAPLSAALTCSVCPAGYSCSGYGTYEPKICVAGTYRSLADSVTCRLCPTGTYSTSNGSTDISLCLPCPEGRVCGEQGMFNLSVSDRCPEGHVCGTGTDRSTMFEHKCPAGTYCGLETLPVDQFVYACDAGYFCRTGTTKQMRNRDRCAVGYFCPPATADPGHPEIRCPYFTTTSSAFGQTAVSDCLVETQHICDKRVASEFDPYEDQRYYAFLNYTIMDGSGEIDQIIGGDGVGEISVVASIMPVNVSAVSPNYTAPNWRNETVELFRTCPEYVKESGGEEIIVVGRNFYDSSLLMCRFTACRFTVDGNGRRDPRSCAVPDRWDRYYLCANQIFNPTSISLVDFHTGYYSPDAETGTYPSLRDVADRSVIIANQFPQSCHMVDGELHYLQTCAEEDNARCYVKCEQSQTEDCDDEDGCETVVGECNDAVTAATPHGFRPIRDLVMRLTQNEMNDELAAHPNIRGPDPLYAGGASVNRWNPCYSAEVAVGNTHPERKEVPGSWAVMTYIINSKWVPDADTIAMDVGRCSHMDTSEEGDHTREGCEMVYYEHYRLAIYVARRCDEAECDSSRAFLDPQEKYPCRQPLLLPEWFNSTTTPKNIVFNMTLFALDDVIFKIEFHIMHGGWLAAAAFFRNTATVQIVTPRRAKFVNEYSPESAREEEQGRKKRAAVPTVVQNDRDLIVDSTWFDPFQGDYDMYDVCDELAGECDPPDGYPVDTSASAAHDVYFETFFRPEINPDTEDSLDFMQGFIEDKHVLLPYMPYFSNCREWDSYIPFSNLVESDQCALPPDTTRMAETPETKPTPTKRYSHPPLPHFDSIQAVKAPDLFVQFDMVPLADWCERTVECTYEERHGHGGRAALIVFERGRNSDELIPVSVANGDGECADVIGYGCYPTRMILEIGYKQRVSDTWKEKNIIFAFLHFVEFNTAGVDPTVELPEYTLLLSYHPLDYIDLIIWFAFETKVFIGIFAFTGGMTVLVGFVLWVSGVILGLFPITLAMLTMTVMVRQVIPAHVLFAFQPGFPLENRADSIYAEMMAGMAFNYLLYSGEGGESMDRGLMPIEWSDPVIIKEKLDAARKGRLGLSFIMMAIMCWYAGCRMFLPDRISQREIDMQKRRDPAAEKEDIWKPNMWKRSNLIFSSFMIGLLCCVVCEFSYWQYFGTYIWFVIIGLRPIGQFLGPSWTTSCRKLCYRRR